MLIDIHTHTAEKRHPKLTRPGGTSYPTPERLIEMMDAQGIDKAVILSGVSPECRYTIVPPEEILRIAKRYPERFIPFCNLDPRFLTNSEQSNFRHLLEAYKELGFKGIGEYTPNIPFDDPLNMNFFKYAEESGLPLTFHIAPKQGGYYGCVDDIGLPRLEKVLKTFPGLKFLGHSQPFWAEISTDVSEENRNSYPKGPVTPERIVELMRRYPNLHGDLSAGSGFNAISRDPEFGYAFMEEFSDRLYFGTDIANDPQDNPLVGYFKKLEDEHLVSAETLEKIKWGNASRLLNLGTKG
jgi:uncharacterized protein